MKRNLRVISPDDPPPRPAVPRPPVRQVVGELWWKFWQLAVVVAGTMYVVTCVSIVVQIWQGERNPYDAMAAGLLLLFVLVMGLWVARRLRRPADVPGPGVQVIEHHHFHHDER